MAKSSGVQVGAIYKRSENGDITGESIPIKRRATKKRVYAQSNFNERVVDFFTELFYDWLKKHDYKEEL